MIDRALLTELLRVYPWQPASAFYRAAELGHLFACGPVPPEGRVLDFGCGDGEVTRIYDAHYHGLRTWDGVDSDISERMLAVCSMLYSQVTSRVSQYDLYDFAFSNSVLEHVESAAISGILRDIHIVLKPNAPFLLTVPGPDFHRHLRTRNVAAFDRKHAIRTLWDEASWRRALWSAGFEVRSCTTYLSRAEVRRWEILTAITSGVLCALTGHRYRPIELQRKLGLRRCQRMPRWLARSLATLLALPLRHMPGQDTHYAITAVRAA